MANPYMGAPSVYGGYDPYNPGVPYSYANPYRTPYTPTYTGTTQPVVQQAIGQQSQQMGAQGQSLQCIQVPNADYAKSVVLNPNQTLYMVSQNSPELYAKAADSMGVATMKYFKLVEFDPTMEAAQQAVNTQIGNVVSREEFNQFANSVAAQFNAIQSGLSSQGNIPVQQTVQAPPQAPIAPVAPIQQEANTPAKTPAVASKKRETASA